MKKKVKGMKLQPSPPKKKMVLVTLAGYVNLKEKLNKLQTYVVEIIQKRYGSGDNTNHRIENKFERLGLNQGHYQNSSQHFKGKHSFC